MLILGNQFPCLGQFAGLLANHALLVEGALSAGADLADACHGLDGLLHEVAVVSDGFVAAGAEEEGAVYGHFLAGLYAGGLGPLEFVGVSAVLEVLVAFTPAGRGASC